MQAPIRTALRWSPLTLALAIGLAVTAQAQAPGSTGPTPSAPGSTPAAVPLDGGASLLLAGGVAYGLKRLRRRQS